MLMRPVVEAQICVKATIRLRYRCAHIVPMPSRTDVLAARTVSFGRAKISLSIIDVK